MIHNLRVALANRCLSLLEISFPYLGKLCLLSIALCPRLYDCLDLLLGVLDNLVGFFFLCLQQLNPVVQSLDILFDLLSTLSDRGDRERRCVFAETVFEDRGVAQLTHLV
jgi:hypothetical protein